MTEMQVPAGVSTADVADVTGVVGTVAGTGHIIGPTFNFRDGEGLQEVRELLSRTPRTRRDRVRLLRPDASFVPPPGLPALVERLAKDRTILLSGPSGGGLPSSAWFLVGELARRLDQDGTELTAEEVLLEKGLRLADQLDQDHLALMINLVDGQPVDLDELHRDLGRFLPELERRQAYLVVTIPGDEHDRFAVEFPGRVHGVSRPPDATEVFDRHLRGTAAESLARSCKDIPWLSKQLAGAWPPRAARLAGQVLEAHTAGRHDAQSVVDYVRQLDEDLSAKLHDVFAEQTTGEWRGLLIAAAALEGAPPAAVVSAAELLLDSAGQQPTPVPVLERPGVAERLKTLAAVGLDPRTTRFGRSQFALSVLEYVWAEHPDLRTAIVSWFERLPVSLLSDVDREVAESFTDRVVELSVRHGAGIALGVADRWASRDARLPRSMAARALGQASIDPQIGWSVRQRLYSWCHQPGNLRRKRVVAEVCGGELGLQYPKVALTRLKHLAAEQEPDLTRAVTAAVTRIADEIGLPELLRLLALNWSDRAASLVDPVRRALMETDHDTWLAERRNRDEQAVARFWQVVLSRLRAREITSMLTTWLDCALAVTDEHRMAMVEMVVTAARGDLRRLGALGYAAARWPTPVSWEVDPGGDRIEAIAAHLRVRLDEIDPLLSESTEGNDRDE
jgi:hypothetical protein